MNYAPYQPTWVNPYAQQPFQQATAQPQAFQQPTNTFQQPTNGIVKVNGRDSALQVQLPPNSTSIPLIDSGFDGKRGTFYVVSTDGTGTKTVEAYDFSPHVDEPPVRIDGANFVSREEYDQFVAKVSAALEAINGLGGTVHQHVANGATVDVAKHDAGGHITGGAGVGANMP